MFGLLLRARDEFGLALFRARVRIDLSTYKLYLFDGAVAGQQLDVLIAGDDEEGKRKVAHLVSDGGLNAMGVGPLARAV